MSTKKEKLVIANFKMNFNLGYELDQWFLNFSKAKKRIQFKNTRLVFCPPFLHFDSFLKKIKSKQVSFGTQDCFWEQKGAFTGEISPTMIKSFGGEFVILGHSERRKYKGETDQTVNQKIQAALKAGLRPILCIGETAQQKKADILLEAIKKQFKQCLFDVNKSKIEKVVLCYEPVWAISANKPDHLPTTNEIMGAKLLIKKLLTEEYGANITDRMQIIYGGSVNPKNAEEVCVEAGMDGALVGGASMLPHDFIRIAQILDGQN